MTDGRTVRIYHYSDPTESIDAVLLALGRVPGGTANHNATLMDAIHRWASTALAGAMQNVGGTMATDVEQRKTMFTNLPSREATDNESTTQCSICLEAFKAGEKISRPLCVHEFHAACLWQWMKEHDTCPVCRFKSF